jgi:D-alanyl-D-alanine carboxypeptidase
MKQTSLQAALQHWQESASFPGASLGVVRGNEAPQGLVVGWADKERKVAMKPTDRMLQGSVGKTYVAAVVLQLVQEKKLVLDEKLSVYLGKEPWFGRLPNAAELTLRQLMRHTSGLVRFEFKDEFVRDLLAHPDKVWKPEERLAYIFDTKAPFAAGQGWEYSDTNFIVLGMVIEHITRSRYYDEAKKRLLKPFQLKDTLPSDRRRIPRLVQGYAGKDNPFGGSDTMLKDGQLAFNPQVEWCGGGMASTAKDLARWGKQLYETKAFSQELHEEQVHGVPAQLGPDVTYGLGTMIRPTPLGVAWGHSGFFPGYLTELLYFPEHKLSMALQVNTSVPKTLDKPLVRQLIELAELAK